MASEPPRIRYGQIVWAVVRDRNGFRKRRPGVVVTATQDIRPDAPLVLMAVTTTFPDPAPDGHISLPWNADPRRVATRLARRSAAVVNWLDIVYPDEIEEVMGAVPPPVMARLQRALDALAAGPKATPTDPNQGGSPPPGTTGSDDRPGQG